MYHSFRTDGTPPTKEDLEHAMVNSFHEYTPGALLCFVKDTNGELKSSQTIHELRAYPGVPGFVSCHRFVFGLIDDNDVEDIELTPLDIDFFSDNAEVNICTVAHHKTTFENSPDVEILPVRLDAVAMTGSQGHTQVHVHSLWNVVPLVLDKGPYTSRQAFLVMYAHITTAGLLSE